MQLTDIITPKSIYDLPKELVIELQECLKIGGYLQQVDGIVGAQTEAAFAQFKTDCWLTVPCMLGETTAKALLELKDKRTPALEATSTNGLPDTNDKKPEVLPHKTLGSRTGKTMHLPTGSNVYENELIVPGVALTWGEATKGCTRIPTEVEFVKNAIELAKRFGGVRDKFGSPLFITSGFRPDHPDDVNKACGGKPISQHIYFKALDIFPLNGDFPKLWQVLKSSTFSGLGDGVTTGKGFYHVDIRNSNRVIFGY